MAVIFGRRLRNFAAASIRAATEFQIKRSGAELCGGDISSTPATARSESTWRSSKAQKNLPPVFGEGDIENQTILSAS
jgi:hypothetical protein